MIKSKVLILCLLYVCVTTYENVPVFNIDSFNDQSYLPIRPNSKFKIEMEGNPTTGFQWYLESREELEKSKLVLPLNLNEHNSGEFFRPGTDDNMVGKGGIYHFKFQTGENAAGGEKLNFVYKRSWTDEGAVRKSVNVQVINSQEDL